MGTIFDTDQRRRALDALAASEDRFARAQHAAQIGTWDWNIVSGETTWTDEAWRLYGFTPSSRRVTHDLWLQNIHPEDAASAATQIARSFTSGTYRDQFRMRQAGGTYRWLESAGETVRDRDDRAIRMLGTVQDVTERRELELALRDALDEAGALVKTREQLVSLVSHDLRNPLGTIVLAIATLGESLAGHPTISTEIVGRAVAMVTRHTSRMERLIGELLDVAQLQAHRELALSLSGFDLAALVREAVDDLPVASTRRIKLDLPTQPLVGTWDRQRIERIIGNLLSNAIKYSSADSGIDVVVDLGTSAATARLRVTDRGIGIPAAELPMIFEWFARGTNAKRGLAPGIGIGLAGVRQIVEQHGGAISVTSQEGRGSTFLVELPLETPLRSRSVHDENPMGDAAG
jgi:phosphoserine phosphatase RsbU/P